MTFDNLCEIIEGKCLNIPSVNAYEKIETKSHLIKRGDLFVGDDKKAIKEAIDNGAYGIVHAKETIMIDTEVAWIKVASCDDALIKLLRFSLLTSEALFFYFPPIEYAILKQIVQKTKVIFLEDSVNKNFKKILEAENNSFFISTKQDFLTQIYPDYLTYHERETSLLKLTQHSLFLSSFTYEDRHYEEIQLPALFLPALNRVLHYLREAQLPFEIERLSFLKHFRPLFISNRYTIRPFGHSEHAFIVEPDARQIEDSLRYIHTAAPWAEVLLFLPKNNDFKGDKNISVVYYEDLEEIKNITIDKFNFILILANYNELSSLLQNNKTENSVSLF